ncbi:MAG TPA: M14 family metallopeptidase [Vicinamibacterales bacterium]|nr:M14 family metallopeptidase [Vicinamibacterales bacterium]
MRTNGTLFAGVALLAAAAAGLAQTKSASPLASLTTRPERTAYRETSRYQDVIEFLQALRAAAPKTVHLTTFGYTVEGRSLPLAVLGAPDATPEAVRRSGKLRVYIQANIHAGEVEGKESTQTLLRDLARGRHADWLSSMVLLVAPIYNADGNERVSLTNRGRQHGPLGGMGQRANAQDLDLNRDHVKLESPEARSLIRFMNEYDPHVCLDLHTTNGSFHAYHLTYAPPLNPATDPAIIDLLRREWLPTVTSAIKANDGWDFYYYGNVVGPGRGGLAGGGAARRDPASSGPERIWATFDHRPRFNNNYVGLRNRIAILSEAYAYLTFEERIRATSRFVEENLAFAHAQAPSIRRLLDEADRRTLVGSQLGVRAELQPSPQPVDILMGEVVEEQNPYSGQMLYRRAGTSAPERMIEQGTFRPTESERVPAAYYVPGNLRNAIDRLRAHGIAATSLQTRETRQVEEFRIDGNEVAAREFQGHKERTLRGAWVPAERELPAGTLRIDMSQPLARLAFYLLEPRSDDGLVNWNLLDEALGPEARTYPIVRTP